MQSQLTNLAGAGSAPFFVLNLQSFVLLCQMKGIDDMETTWTKIKIIFNAWQKIRERGSSTQRSLDAATAMQRGRR